MFCSKCGTQIPDGAQFCQNCGAPIQPTQPVQPIQPTQPIQPIQPTQPVQPMPPQAPIYTSAPVVAPAEKPKKKIKPLAIIIPVVAVILAAAIALTIVFWPDKSEKTEEAGNSKTEETSDNEENTNTKEKEYFASKIIYMDYDEDGNERSRTTHVYYDNQNLESEIYEYQGNITNETVYERDDQGRVTKITSKSKDGTYIYVFSDYVEENGIYVAEAECEYDNHINRFRYGYKDGKMYIEEYFYDGMPAYSYIREGNTITYKEYDNGELSIVITEELDDNDNTVSTSYEHRSYTEDNYGETRKYDKNGNLIELIRTDYKGKFEYKEVREFDENNNCIYYAEYDVDGLAYERKAKFDEHSICIESKYTDEDGAEKVQTKLRSQSENQVIVEEYFSTGEMDSYTEYTIEDGKLIESRTYSGETDELRTIECYNEQGLLETYSSYYNGELSSKTVFEYSEIK